MLSKTGESYRFISIAGGGRRGKKKQKVSNGLCKLERKICFTLLLLVFFFLMLFQPENSKLYYCFFKETAIKTNNVKLVSQAELNQVKTEQKCNFCSFALFMRVYYIYYSCVYKKLIYIFVPLRLSGLLLNV